MRFFVAFALLVAGFSVTSHLHAEDNELFSEVAMETVYSQLKDDKQEDSEHQVDLPKRMTGNTSLMGLLTDAGFQPTQIDGRGVSVKIEHGQWKLPVYMNADVSRDRLVIEIPLAKIEDEAKIDHAKLLKLLMVGNNGDGVNFTYNKEDGLIELRRVMDNRGFTPTRIKQELSDIAKIAQTHQDAWSGLGTAAKPERKDPAPTSVAPRKTAPKTKPPAEKLTLVGTWSASIGKGEAFAIEIKRDATFQLVHIKAGKSVSSNGKASKTGSQLTLAGSDGNKIVGTLTQTTANAFGLTISGTTLNFKKAK